MRKLIIIVLVIVGCSDPSEEITTIIPLDPSLNNGTWVGESSTMSFVVDSLTVSEITIHPWVKGEDESTYEFRADTLHIKHRLRVDNGSYSAMDWVMKWDIGSDEAPGYLTLVTLSGEPVYATKQDITFHKK